MWWWRAQHAAPRLLEEVAELKVQFPGWLRVAQDVHPVEAVRIVDAEWSERRNHGRADAGAAEQPGRIELRRPIPDVAGVQERREIEHLRHAHAQLAGKGEERLAERIRARAVGPGGGIVPERRDGGLVIAAERNEELGAAQGEQLFEERRVAEHEAGPRREAEDELHVGLRGVAERADRGVEVAFEIDALEVARAAQRSAALRRAELHHGARGRERQVDPRVAHQRGAECRADTIVAAERRREREVRRGADEALLIEAVIEEQARVVVAEDGEAELEVPAAAPEPADVGDDVAHARVVHADRRRDARLAHGGIGVRDVEIVDVLSELPLEPAALALPEQIRLVEPEEAADAGALSHRRAEVDVAGPLLGNLEHDVDVALIVRRL